tara:strand:- start:2172 stop:2384 length:213 start_codon:yes stop_codon:yes gene_type:complete
MNKSDLIHIPSDVTLLQFNSDSEDYGPLFATRSLKTKKPKFALLLKNNGVYYKILYNGEFWFVNAKDAYQ